MKKFIIALATIVVLCVPAFADTSYFIATPYSFTSGNWTSCELTSVDSNNPVYFYFQDNKLHAISEFSSSIWREVGITAYNQSVDVTYQTAEPFDNYYTSLTPVYVNAPFSGSSEITAFANTATASVIASAFSEYLGNLEPPTPAVESNFNIPCGNVVYFQVTYEQDVNFKSYNQVLSSLLTFSSLGPWGDTGQRFGPAASLPSSGTSFPLLSQDPIHWNIDASSVNLLGQSRTAIKTVHCLANQWYAFYNPAYNSNNTDWTVNDITGATVGVFGSFSQVKVYPLEQVVDFSNGSFVGSSNDDYQSYYDGTIGEDGTVTFIDQDGNISVPSAGGQNLLAPNESYQSLIDRVIGILDEIVNELKSLFTFGYEAVQSLVGLFSDFVSSFSQLYTWLPAPVYSALISAVTIAIVIGVFKVFL